MYVDDDGNIKINGRHIQMTTSDDLGSYIDKTIKQEAAALVVQLTNEYIGITTDSNGNGGNFTDCYTDVLVFSGSTDITKSSDLRIRSGAGTNYPTTGEYTGKGTFTIIEEKAGTGSTKGWGKLKSGAGWISLDYCVKL